MVTTSYEGGQRPDAGRDGRGPLGTLQDGAQAALHNVREQGSEQFEAYRDTAAEQLEALAEGARAAGEHLGAQDPLGVSHYISDMAQSMGSLAEGLRGKSADQLLHQAGQLARDNPALFLAGSVAVGFGLSRLLRASASQERAPFDDAASAGAHRSGEHAADGYADGYSDSYTDDYGAAWADEGANAVIAADEGVALTPAHVNDTPSSMPGNPGSNLGATFQNTPGSNQGGPSSPLDPLQPAPRRPEPPSSAPTTPDSLNQGNRNKGDLE